MIVYPAIDLLDGNVVRLSKGDFATAKVYSTKPETIAQTFADEGADWLHVVDLSGARARTPCQTQLIGRLTQCGVKVQAGGGVRTAPDIRQLKEDGIDRVIVGSQAIAESDMVAEWLGIFGAESLVVALDLRIEGDRLELVSDGWTRRSGLDLNTVLPFLISAGLRHALVTDVSRDGELAGPNRDLYARLVDAYTGLHWQASGGVSKLDDLTALKATGVSGTITGRALYENRFTLSEALACLQNA